jgi:hypothetical protein
MKFEHSLLLKEKNDLACALFAYYPSLLSEFEYPAIPFTVRKLRS